MRQCTITLPEVQMDNKDVSEIHSAFVADVVKRYKFLKTTSTMVFVSVKDENGNEDVQLTDAFDYSFPVDELMDYDNHVNSLVRKYKLLLKIETIYVVWPNGQATIM